MSQLISSRLGLRSIISECLIYSPEANSFQNLKVKDPAKLIYDCIFMMYTVYLFPVLTVTGQVIQMIQVMHVIQDIQLIQVIQVRLAHL